MTDSSAANAPGTAEPVRRNQARRRLTLRGQGFILLGIGLALVLAYGTFIATQREKLLEQYMAVENQQKLEDQFVRIGNALFRVDRTVDEALTLLPDPATAAPEISRYFAQVVVEWGGRLKSYPQLDAELKRVTRDIDTLRDGDVRANLVGLARDIHRTATRLDSIIGEVAAQRSNLSAEHVDTYLTVTLTSAIVSILALGGFGSFVIYFFNRLTSAIDALRVRAREIQVGKYSAPLAIDRGDEVGELMDAMNRMAATLQQRERDLAISRQSYFHEEKMMAVKSLAAGVAHEVGNPIESISIVAQGIADAKAQCCESKGAQCHPDVILEQTRRIGRITREISNFTVPSVPDPQLQNINELIRGACNFIRYDRRYRSTDLALELDATIPPIRLVADQFIQVLLNLLINAADACETRGDCPTRVVISTQRVDAGVAVRVVDSGCGMNEETLDHAFEAFFTTKSAGRGSGLGLVVCKSIIEACGGTMHIASQEQIGTSVEIFMPAD